FLTRPLGAWGAVGRLTDGVFATAGLCVGFYLAYRYPVLSTEYYTNKTEAAAIGLLLIPLTLEGVRRTAGPALAVVTLAFMGYALIADMAPGQLQGRAMEPTSLVAFSAVDNVAIFGLPLTIAGTVVVMFVVFGQLLQQTGGANWFTDLATCAVGRYRGGPAKIAVVASGLFGSISGSAVANVASTGILTIPMMKKAGFPAHRAAAYEAVASTGGQIAPPIMGAAAFLMAEFLELTYAEVIAAAAIPAVLYYFAVLLTVDMDAARLGAAALPRDQVPPVTRVLRGGWFYSLPFAMLVFALFAWNLGPAEAALWAAATLLAAVGLFGRGKQRITPAKLWRTLANGGIAAVDVILVGAAAGIVIGILENTGLSFGLTYLLVGLAEGELWIMLVATAVICVLLGMGMPTTGIYLLVATLAGPPLIELGIHPLAAHMFVLYFGLMSMISPPVAIAAFTAASIAGAGPMKTAMTAMRVGWIAFVMPFLFIADTSLILQGSLTDILIAVTAVAFGIWAVAAGMSGYLIIALTGAERVATFAAGALLLLSRFNLPFRDMELVVGGAGLLALYLWTRRRSTVGA
ncbi:MAG: TRAP transporter fused permease subunit, partial [Alphaproteobacteria bacterium]|nr:TRAP transporter fused permease subunit [Alphaproteobacteria bacterium]